MPFWFISFKSFFRFSICVSHCYFLGIDKSWPPKPSACCCGVIHAYRKVKRLPRSPSPAFIACLPRLISFRLSPLLIAPSPLPPPRPWESACSSCRHRSHSSLNMSVCISEDKHSLLQCHTVYMPKELNINKVIYVYSKSPPDILMFFFSFFDLDCNQTLPIAFGYLL